MNYSHLTNERNKWTKYYLSEYQNMLIDSFKNNDKFQKFEDVALINVGITTGNNDYFQSTKRLLMSMI